MKKRSSFAIFLWVILLSLALMSVATSSNIQTNVLSTRINAAPSKPTVNIEYPSDGSSLVFGTYIIDVFASDPTGITIVKLKIDGPESTNGWVELPASETVDHYYYEWSVGTEGDYSITVRATNGANRQAADTVGVTVVAAPPEPVHDVAVTGVSAAPTSVEIGENVIVTVDVENQGGFTETFDITAYYDSVTIGTQTVTKLAGASDTLTFTWDTTDVAEGEYTIKAEASVVPEEEDTADNSFTDGIVTVTAPGAPPTATHELFIEIDYLEEHAPTQAVLDYIEWYYMGNNPSGELISVTFDVNESIKYVDAYAGINDDEFWGIEAQYNDHDYGYYSKWKWVLFGTTVEDEPKVVGYTYVLTRGNDLLAGNYIFIADETADKWATTPELEIGAEAVVLMHEIGHSIGIANFHPAFGEIYDPDPSSVMSYLSTANAGLYWAWYYSDDYWATRNMEYYTI